MEKAQWEPDDNTLQGWLVLTTGILAASTASVLIRLTPAPSLVVGTWRLLLAGILLAPIAWRPTLTRWQAIPRRKIWLLLASSLALAAHFAAWISSLAYTTVASSVILVSSSPIFLALASCWLFRERTSRTTMLAIAMGLTGTAVVAYGDLGLTDRAMIGNAFALLGAVAVSVYILLGRQLRQWLPTLAYVWPCYTIAGLFLGAIALASGHSLFEYTPRTYALFVALAIVPQILGHSAFNWAVRRVPPVYVSIAMLGEPIGATLLAWMILQEPPGLLAIVGGALILAGILVASPAITKNLHHSSKRSVPTS